MLAKLSELLFVEAVRRYAEALPEDQTGWFAGLRDLTLRGRWHCCTVGHYGLDIKVTAGPRVAGRRTPRAPPGRSFRKFNMTKSNSSTWRD